MGFKNVSFLLGRLAFGMAAVLMLPCVFALVSGEAVWYAFAEAVLLTSFIAFAMRSFGRLDSERLTVRDGIAVTGLGWLLAAFLGMVPYAASGALGPLDGFVESVSGFSGTGATVFDTLSGLPGSLLLWRALTHWLGGLGIVVIFIALLPQFGHGAIYLFEAESTGPDSERFLPRVKAMAVSLFLVYFVFTFVCALAYLLAGMTPLDAVCHSMATIATGGFSTHDESIAYFNSPLIEGIAIVFMLLSSANIGLYVVALRRGVGAIFGSDEYRAYLSAVLVVSAVIAFDLAGEMGLGGEEAFRAALFQAASVSSSTGFVSADFDLWPPLSKLCLVFLMFMGGCAGSTAGGFKVSRVLLLFRSLALLVQKRLSPKSSVITMMDGRAMDEDTVFGVGQHLFAYAALTVLWTALFIFDGSATFDALTLSLTTMGNVGPAFGEWGATSTYAALPPLSKVVACASMLLGRLEMFTILAMMRPSFWRGGRW